MCIFFVSQADRRQLDILSRKKLWGNDQYITMPKVSKTSAPKSYWRADKVICQNQIKPKKYFPPFSALKSSGGGVRVTFGENDRSGEPSLARPVNLSSSSVFYRRKTSIGNGNNENCRIVRKSWFWDVRHLLEYWRERKNKILTKLLIRGSG